MAESPEDRLDRTMDDLDRMELALAAERRASRDAREKAEYCHGILVRMGTAARKLLKSLDEPQTSCAGPNCWCQQQKLAEELKQTLAEIPAEGKE